MSSVALSRPVGAGSATRFEAVDAAASGLAFRHYWADVPEPYRLELETSNAGGGVCVGDYDGDGLADLFLTRPFGGARLYRNLGGLRFEDVTARAGLAGDTTWATGASFADIDNDGDLDLYVCGYDTPNRLWINRGDGTFEERARDAGLDFRGASVMMAFADYDNDGDLDGYLVTNRLRPRGDVKPQIVADADGRPQLAAHLVELFCLLSTPTGGYILHDDSGQFDRLYRNEGDGTFRQVATEAGLTGAEPGLAAVWFDHDGDGFPDVYVSNDFYGRDQLWHNNGDGTFTDVIAQFAGHIPWFSMGADIADVNNDGLIDLLASDMAGADHYNRHVGMGNMAERQPLMTVDSPHQVMWNALYLGTGAGPAIEAASLDGVAATDWTWSVRFADLDNDGYEDLFVTNGMTRDGYNTDLVAKARQAPGSYLDNLPTKPDLNRVFRNTGGLRFEDVGVAWGLSRREVSFGAAVADLDNDGDLDIVINNFDAPAELVRNNSADSHAIRVRLVGVESNRYGIGATVRVTTDDSGTQTRYATLSRGFASATDPTLHFGLGSHATVRSLAVDWPSGRTQELTGLAADRLYTILEPSDGPHRQTGDGVSADQTLFQYAPAMLSGVRHRETPYDDFSDQPLLPEKFSQVGAPIAAGDLDGDGDTDLLFGGAAGQPISLQVNDGGGAFAAAEVVAFAADAAGEDQHLLLFDADGDGDLDIYAAKGSSEFGPTDPRQRDRLYLNDGSAGFAAANPEALPADDGFSIVAAAADVDGDGDRDLFVGSRLFVGAYPLPPRHRLLVNDGSGRFSDATDARAEALRDAGMVTDAIFIDIDGDGDSDLDITHDFGPVRVLVNDGGGRFTDATASAGLDTLTGRWRCVTAVDIDGDGDTDLAVSNEGLNGLEPPRADRPRRIFFGAFLGMSTPRLVEGYTAPDGRLLPLRTRPHVVAAIPGIEAVAPTYDAYARATLGELYDRASLDAAYSAAATTFESGILINDGRGRFTFEPLPTIAQVSPVNAIAAADLDGDGTPDLALAQNVFHTHPLITRQDGGVGMVLLNTGGDAASRLTPVWPNRSGVVLPEQHPDILAIDLDGDARPDLIATTNDDVPRVFINQHR